MKFIAHRGNINGPQPDHENDPKYIDEALAQKYDAEIDLWFDGKFYLGHDQPQYEIPFEYLTQQGLWIHCKDHSALVEFMPTRLNFFYHTNEDYVLTSHKYIWAYPGKLNSKYTICVMPEWNNTVVQGYAGVCSDYVNKWYHHLNP